MQKPQRYGSNAVKLEVSITYSHSVMAQLYEHLISIVSLTNKPVHYPMTAATPVGTVTVNEHGQEITLTNKQVIEDTIEYYNVITDYHMNLFSDSVLTSCRFNNIYPITDMKFAKDSRTLRTREEFENVEDRFFYGLRLAEQTFELSMIEWYVNRLLSTEVATQPELAV